MPVDTKYDLIYLGDGKNREVCLQNEHYGPCIEKKNELIAQGYFPDHFHMIIVGKSGPR